MNQKDKIRYVEAVTSTNRYMESEIASGHSNSGFMLVAGFQTQGRGQTGNTWESEKDKNLLASLYYEPAELEAVNQFYLAKTVALACREMLSEHTDEISLKWPNDIYVHGKKIGGILIENSIMGSKITSSIIGVGVNLNQITFSPGLPNPTSLQLITGKNYNLKEWSLNLHMHLLRWLNRLDEQRYDDIDRSYHELLYRRDGWYGFIANGEPFDGKITGVLPTGQLIIETEMGEQKFWFKEVEFILD